ncbi:MAG: DUF11 domain-containing protein [Candidatus Doudnabacteria bacterium]|nr:DUF11 domain-containing protein [Candidatus Doudnabacteria bacterium]
MIRIQTNRDEPLYTVTGPGGSFSSRGSRIFFNQRAGNYSIQIEDLPNFIETVTPTSGTLPCDGSLSFIITYTSIVAATTPTIQPVAIVAGGNVDLVLSKRVSTTAARPGDAVVYTLTVENRGNANSNSFVVEDELADVLQLAELLDFGGAQFDLARHKLTWPAVVVPAFGRVEKTFSVRVRNSFPAGSDSVMTNVYGNRVDVNVVRPQVAGAFVAPKTGAKTTISFGLSILTLSGYIIAHRRKGKERTIENPL